MLTLRPSGLGHQLDLMIHRMMVLTSGRDLSSLFFFFFFFFSEFIVFWGVALCKTLYKLLFYLFVLYLLISVSLQWSRVWNIVCLC